MFCRFAGKTKTESFDLKSLDFMSDITARAFENSIYVQRFTCSLQIDRFSHLWRNEPVISRRNVLC